jgi:hypothetical protein
VRKILETAVRPKLIIACFLSGLQPNPAAIPGGAVGNSPIYGVPGTVMNSPAGTIIGTAGGAVSNSPVAGAVQGIPGTVIGSLPYTVVNGAGQVIGTVGGAIPQPPAGVVGTAAGTVGGAAAGLPVQPFYGNMPYAVSRGVVFDATLRWTLILGTF